jgi:hypothetical protein
MRRQNHHLQLPSTLSEGFFLASIAEFCLKLDERLPKRPREIDSYLLGPEIKFIKFYKPSSMDINYILSTSRVVKYSSSLSLLLPMMVSSFFRLLSVSRQVKLMESIASRILAVTSGKWTTLFFTRSTMTLVFLDTLVLMRRMRRFDGAGNGFMPDWDW